MGKRIDELTGPGLDQPLPPSEPEDVRDAPWFQFVGEIDDLLNNDDFHWAFDTLSGIKETVEHRRQVTEAQRRAVRNIGESQAGRRSRGSRRYEGWRPR